MYVGLRLTRLSKLKTPDFILLVWLSVLDAPAPSTKQVSIRRLYTSYQTLSHFITSLISGKIMELLTQQLLWFRLRMKKQFEDGWLIYRVLLHETGNLLDGQR